MSINKFDVSVLNSLTLSQQAFITAWHSPVPMCVPCGDMIAYASLDDRKKIEEYMVKLNKGIDPRMKYLEENIEAVTKTLSLLDTAYTLATIEEAPEIFDAIDVCKALLDDLNRRHDRKLFGNLARAILKEMDIHLSLSEAKKFVQDVRDDYCFKDFTLKVGAVAEVRCVHKDYATELFARLVKETNVHKLMPLPDWARTHMDWVGMAQEFIEKDGYASMFGGSYDYHEGDYYFFIKE